MTVSDARGVGRHALLALLICYTGQTAVSEVLSVPADADPPAQSTVTLSCNGTTPPTVLQGQPTGEGSDGVWVGSNGADGSPQLHLEPDAAQDFRKGSMVASVGIATQFDHPAVGALAEASRALTLHYCAVGLVSRAIVESTWTDGAPVTRVTASLPRGWADAMRGMRAGERRLLLFSGDQNSGVEPIEGLQPNEPVAIYVELLDVGT